MRMVNREPIVRLISRNLLIGNAYVGECILGDFRAAQELGQEVLEATTTHWPGRLENPSLSLYHTSAAIDFFQLTITLLERADALELYTRPTPASCRAAISNLKDAELQSFLSGLLQHQE